MKLRIGMTAADLGFETSEVGSVDNVPTHPGYEGTAHLDAVSTLVGADVALDAALAANATADADQATLDAGC